MKSFKGEISVTTAIITAIGLIGGSIITSWATASSRINATDTKVEVVQEREDNHYQELLAGQNRLEAKVDRILEKQGIVYKEVPPTVVK